MLVKRHLTLTKVTIIPFNVSLPTLHISLASLGIQNFIKSFLSQIIFNSVNGISPTKVRLQNRARKTKNTALDFASRKMEQRSWRESGAEIDYNSAVRLGKTSNPPTIFFFVTTSFWMTVMRSMTGMFKHWMTGERSHTSYKSLPLLSCPTGQVSFLFLMFALSLTLPVLARHRSRTFFRT